MHGRPNDQQVSVPFPILFLFSYSSHNTILYNYDDSVSEWDFWMILNQTSIVIWSQRGDNKLISLP